MGHVSSINFGFQEPAINSPLRPVFVGLSPGGLLPVRMATLFTAAILSTLASNVADAGPKKSADTVATAKTDIDARRQVMNDVKSWAIQLRYIDREKLSATPIDLVVIDHAPHPKQDVEKPFLPEEIAPLKGQPDGKRRLVVAYLSIGEAERYRYYWNPAWDVAETRPAWLGSENPRWPGDYQVKFSDPDWQSIIFGTPQSYLERIVASGFDGVYLDRVDAYQDVEATVPGAEDAMAGFVTRLADHARRLNPRFLVIMQNAEELVRRKSLVSRLDAIAKEDLAFGGANTEEPNPPQMVRDTVQYLRRAKHAGLKIFMLEYVGDAKKAASARALASREGFIIHFTERLLGTLTTDAPDRPAAVLPKSE